MAEDDAPYRNGRPNDGRRLHSDREQSVIGSFGPHVFEAIALAFIEAGYDPRERDDLHRLVHDLRANREFQARMAAARTNRSKWLTRFISALVPLAALALWQWLTGVFHSLVSGFPPHGNSGP